MKPSLQALQPLGRALMLPIAVLPIAGMLLRLGQPDLFNLPFVSAAGPQPDSQNPLSAPFGFELKRYVCASVCAS